MYIAQVPINNALVPGNHALTDGQTDGQNKSYRWYAIGRTTSVGCVIVKLCTKFERNRAICDEVIAISVFDLMTLNMYHVFSYALG